MPLVIMRKNGRDCPCVICDHCGGEIADYLSHDGEGVCLRAVVNPETTREEELALYGLALDLDARFPDAPFTNLSVWNPRMFVGDLAYEPRPDDRCLWRRNT